ncbi:MAG: hypothetical protein Q4A08_02115 [Bacteroidales bacterium]|nr:hypothetical protein [Bacteroidales bacterium]
MRQLILLFFLIIGEQIAMAQSTQNIRGHIEDVASGQAIILSLFAKVLDSRWIIKRISFYTIRDIRAAQIGFRHSVNRRKEWEETMREHMQKAGFNV